MRLSEMNARLRDVQRARRGKWTAVALLVILVGDHMGAWLAMATGPFGAALAFEWWQDTLMPYLELSGYLAFGALAAWGAIRTGHPDQAWQLFSAAAAAGSFMFYNARGR
jgi:ABC-type Na+ efflux pump permease subunit